MEVKSETFKIECKKPTLEFLENWFKANNLNVIRYAIVKIEDNVLTLSVSHKI